MFSFCCHQRVQTHPVKGWRQKGVKTIGRYERIEADDFEILGENQVNDGDETLENGKLPPYYPPPPSTLQKLSFNFSSFIISSSFFLCFELLLPLCQLPFLTFFLT